MEVKPKLKRKYVRKTKVKEDVVIEPLIQDMEELLIVSNKEVKMEKMEVEEEVKEVHPWSGEVLNKGIKKVEVGPTEKELKMKEQKEREEKEELEEAKYRKTIKEIYTAGRKSIDLYIYYEGCNVDTLKYIKEVQLEAEKKGVPSQVVICTNEKYERVGLNNCYHTESVPKRWTDIVLSREKIKCVKIKERARETAAELYRMIESCEEIDNNFITVKILD